MTKDKVRVLCVAENWHTKPMARETAERLIEAGYPDCTMGEHRIVPVNDTGDEK